MRVVPDNAHCMKHARSYPLDRECQECRVERIVREIMREIHPHICPVCTPQLWKEMKEL